jgi:hypothetical protein
MTWLVVAVALAAGYACGRWQPARRASDWAYRLPYARPAITRRDARWWLAQVVYAAEIAVLLATRPRRTAHAWRHRNDPPPKSPPVTIRRIAPEEQP